MTRMLKKFIIYLLRFLRNFILYNKLPTCKFHPTCSAYAIESVEKKGVVFGLGKALVRILKCNPFSSGGYDPA